MTYDFDLFVIGAGSGGVRASRMAASFGARVGICEERYLGGTCVNVGCVPKKLFVYAARYASDFKDAAGFGWTGVQPGPHDWPTLTANTRDEVRRLNGIYRRLMETPGVEIMEGRGHLVDAHTVDVGGRRVTAAHILICTGGWPRIPDIPGAEHVMTSNEVFSLPQRPKSLAVVGGGYIGVEFASLFATLGSRVTLIHRGEMFLRGFDQDIREHLHEELSGAGITFRFGTEVSAVERSASEGSSALRLELTEGDRLSVDAVIMATGRVPLTAGLGLNEVGVSTDERGAILVDALYRTSVPHIFAVGDVLGKVQLTPVALAEGMVVAKHLFGPQGASALDYTDIPTAVFTSPEVGTVGLTETQAREAGHRVVVFRSRFRPMRHTLSGRRTRSLMKMVVCAETDRVLGCHMVGAYAGEIIQGLAVAMKSGATKAQFDATIGIHPTAAEEFVTMRTPVATP